MVFVSVENKGAYRCLIRYHCLESWTLKNHVQFICNITLPQCVQTLVLLVWHFF